MSNYYLQYKRLHCVINHVKSKLLRLSIYGESRNLPGNYRCTFITDSIFAIFLLPSKIIERIVV